MTTPRAIRTGIADRLRSIADLKLVYERWPGQVNPPCAIVSLETGEPEQTMGRGDLCRYDYVIEVCQSLAGGWENAEDRMDVLLATSSTGGVFGAIAADRTLGGKVISTFVKQLPREYERRIVDENIELLVASVPLEIWST